MHAGIRFQTVAAIAGLGLLAGVWGCPSEAFPNAEPAFGVQVDNILGDNDLSPQQQREALTELGLTSSVIDSLLRDQQLANQGGGDLNSAHAKIAGSRFTALTADELQYYALAANAADPALGIELGDESAALLVKVLQDNGINSADELADYLEDPVGATPRVINDGTAQSLLVDVDPANPDIVSQLS